MLVLCAYALCMCAHVCACEAFIVLMHVCAYASSVVPEGFVVLMHLCACEVGGCEC